ncbi:MAG: hypothetical protein AB8B95_10040 [Pseudohongiellaceae bacterium]
MGPESLNAATYYELTELMLIFQEARQEQVTLMISCLTGYVVAAHLVAGKLSKIQVFAISAIYTIFLFVLVLGYYSLGMDANEATIARDGTDNSSIYTLMSWIFVLAWLLSILFMYQSRKKAAKDT